MNQIINATPHPVRVLCDVFDGETHYLTRTTRALCPVEETPDGPAYLVPPSGFRLAAKAITSGPRFGCSVSFEAAADNTESAEIRHVFSECQGVASIVIASQISCEAYRDIDDGVLGVRMVWPVIAEAALSQPPSQRWADRLAARQAPIENDVGDIVGMGPYWLARSW